MLADVHICWMNFTSNTPTTLSLLRQTSSNKTITNWLAALSNANHDGTTQQIDDAVGNFETENQVFLQKAQAVHQARVQEDDVWQKSQVDPVVKQLEAADKQQDAYMTAFRYINDGYGAEADKILQMGQNLQTKQEFLTQIGAWQWYVKAAQAAQQVRYLLGERAKTKGEFVKGELKAARRQTDMAIADLYRTIIAMMDLMPSDALTALYTQLKGFERYAREYYLPKGKGEDDPTPDPEPQPEPDVTPVEPEA